MQTSGNPNLNNKVSFQFGRDRIDLLLINPGRKNILFSLNFILNNQFLEDIK
jgi:hypothetical protein